MTSLMDLLDSSGIRIPELDYADEAIWPAPFFEIASASRPQPTGAPALVSESVHEPVIDAPMARRIDSKADELSGDERARQTGYRRRFALIYAGLALVRRRSGSARSSSSSPTPTHDDPGRRAAVVGLSTPTARRTRAPAQIAAHVSEPLPHCRRAAARRAHRRAAARRLQPARGKHPGPAPRGGDPAGPSRPAAQIANREVEIVDTSSAVQYVLCGYGRGCSIASGQPSEARHLLLRREALELALYTFKYLGRVNSVVVFLPPPPGGEIAPRRVVFLRRRELGAAAREAADARRSPRRRPASAQISRAETATLNRITRHRIYQYDYTPSQDGGAILLLDPVTTAP